MIVPRNFHQIRETRQAFHAKRALTHTVQDVKPGSLRSQI